MKQKKQKKDKNRLLLISALVLLLINLLTIEGRVMFSILLLIIIWVYENEN